MVIDQPIAKGSMLLSEVYLLRIISNLVQHSGVSTLIICGDQLSWECLVLVSNVFSPLSLLHHAYSHISMHLIGLQCI